MKNTSQKTKELLGDFQYSVEPTAIIIKNTNTE